MVAKPADPFESVDWDDLYKRLLAVAARLFYTARLGRDGVMVGTGCSPADLAQDTLLKALAGDGIRHEAAKGSLLAYLKKVMTNDFLDLRRQASHRTTNRVNHSADDENSLEGGGLTLDSFEARASHSIEDSAVTFCDAKRVVEDDPELTEYIEAIEIGCIKPGDVAEVCRADIKDIYQRRRRLEGRFASMVKK